MIVTAINLQTKNSNRVNIMIDGEYKLSLDVYQLGILGIKVGGVVSQNDIDKLQEESSFGKLYAQALKYCLMRPHSSQEIKDYLFKKTLDRKVKNYKTGEINNRQGVNSKISDRVYNRLVDKGYVDDEKFACWWIRNRKINTGISIRKLRQELSAKRVSNDIIDMVLAQSDRDDNCEIIKIINKKRSRYPNENKMIAYLARQGFSYEDIKNGLDSLKD